MISIDLRLAIDTVQRFGYDRNISKIQLQKETNTGRWVETTIYVTQKIYNHYYKVFYMIQIRLNTVVLDSELDSFSNGLITEFFWAQ